MRLSALNERQSGIIIKIRGRLPFRKRIMEMGFVPGKEVTLIRKAPFGGPVELQVVGSYIVLRASEADLIEIDAKSSVKADVSGDYAATFEGEGLRIHHSRLQKDITVALIGNPISGKTSLFNMLSGAHEKVGNYSGVTIEPISRLLCHDGYNIRIVDLPGTYALGSEEHVNQIIRDYIYNEVPDVIINVVDASNLERNLFLTTELIDMDVRLLMALNMFDTFEETGDQFDYKAFGKITGVPVVPVSAAHNLGKQALIEAVIALYTDVHPDYRHVHIHYGTEVEQGLRKIQTLIRVPENSFITDRYSSRFLALRLLHKDKIAMQRLDGCGNKQEIVKQLDEEIIRLERAYGQTSENIITNARYGFVAGALKETYKSAAKEKRRLSERIDAILLHKVFGFPIFMAIMWIMFVATFKLGEFPMHWIEDGVALLSSWLLRVMDAGMLRDLLVNGLVSGMGGVIVFLPNILILYFFIALMEDTGYLSRAVFIMDRIMHKIGLHGKSFIPLVMGFGCNVPAILASRMLENRNERIVTILINPFISCNARLPVYILFISAFFPHYSGSMLFGIYALGVFVAILTALLLRKTFFRKAPQAFVMELPPYRMPGAKVLMMHMWRRSAQYLKKIGGVILIASIIFWSLSYFPTNPQLSKDYKQEAARVNKQFDQKIALIPATDTVLIHQAKDEMKQGLHMLELEERSERKEHSYLGMIGHFIEPVIRPLGFDWRIGISIISGIPAKEIIVSSLSILYHVDEGAEDQNATLAGNLKSFDNGRNDGKGTITPLIALSFMIFVLLYLPCIGTLTAISRESGSWKWGAFMMVYSFSVAWLLSFLVFQIGSLMGY